MADAANMLAQGRTRWLHSYIDVVYEGATGLPAVDRPVGHTGTTNIFELYDRPNTDSGVLQGPAFAEVDLASRSVPAVAGFNWFDMTAQERVNHNIDVGLHRLNPGWHSGDPRWRGNCVSVATAFELRQRGYHVQAGALAERLLKNNGYYALHHTLVWGKEITEHGKDGLPFAFREPGSREVVIVGFSDQTVHCFNVVHVPDAGLRFIDGQPDPPVTDASSYLTDGTVLGFMRVDDLKPSPREVADLGIRFLDPEQSLPGTNGR